MGGEALHALPPIPTSSPLPSTWAQNHEFSKSPETTQTGSQGAKRFQRRGAAFPFISKSCPTNDHPPPLSPVSVPSFTQTHGVRAALCRSLLSPFLSTPHSSSSWPMKAQNSQGFPSPIPQSPRASPDPFPSSLPLSFPPKPMCSTAHLVPVVVGPFRGRPGGFS